MERDGVFLTQGTRYILMGIAAVLLIGFISMIPRRGGRSDYEFVEVYVAEKEITQIEGQDVYLLHTEDKNGKQAIYEINQNALGEHFQADNVYKEIHKNKHYQFKVGKAEDYGSHYSCICGAATLIDGFTEETTGTE